jgi:hypothetical protein
MLGHYQNFGASRDQFDGKPIVYDLTYLKQTSQYLGGHTWIPSQHDGVKEPSADANSALTPPHC